jgi:hypothetical protein
MFIDNCEGNLSETEDSLYFLRMNAWYGRLGLTTPRTEVVGVVNEIPIRYPAFVRLLPSQVHSKRPGLKLDLELREYEHSRHNRGVDENADRALIGQTLERSIPGKDVDQG